MIPRKAIFTLATLLAFMATPDYIPALKDYKVFDWSTVPHVLDFQPRAQNRANPIEDEQLRLRPVTTVEKAATQPLIENGKQLDRFYAALAATDRHEPHAITRILHYGDSPTTADLITADVRALLQADFGNSGHGFALIAKPWAWYDHRGLDIRGGGWNIEPANMAQIRDGLYGLGAVSFRGTAGASAFIRVKNTVHTSLEISYLEQPDGGSFDVLLDDNAVGTVDTAGSEPKPAFRRFEAPQGFREFRINDVRGNVRLYGVSFERDTPGVQYNSLGVNGAYISVLARMMNERHWADQLRHYDPNLVVINYGTNESVYGKFVDTAFEIELTIVVNRVKRAVPNASILIMSPMDRGQKMSDGEIGSVPALVRLVSIEQRVAAKENVAFFNTFEAMGGNGTMGRWYRAEPRLVGADFIHPMPAGAKIVGNLLYKSLIHGYRGYRYRIAKEKFETIEEPATTVTKPTAGAKRL